MNHVYPLSEEELAALRQLHRQTRDANVRSRCDMILWSHEGLSPPEIARLVRFSGETVRRCIRRYEAEGVGGLFTKPRLGRPRTVTPAYEAELLTLVGQEPRSLKLPFSNWTTANLAETLAERTRITITPRQVENYLKTNDWRLRRPVHTVTHKQDSELVAEKKTNPGIEGRGDL
jgi:transposase